jgi:hypothetical protein
VQTISESIGLLWEALFLQPQPYIAMRDRKNPAGKGVVILILLGLIVALASYIGSLLTWATSPNINAIQETVLKYLQQMNWWEFMSIDPQVQAVWFQVWDSVWQVVRFLVPSPTSGLVGFIFTPINLLIVWIFFGLVAHLIAKLFGGKGMLGQTLGTTALASAPQLLVLFTAFPYVTFAGITVWTILARYMAIRVTHDLSWGRALWVTLLTMLVMFIILAILFGVGIAAFSSAIAAAVEGGLFDASSI